MFHDHVILILDSDGLNTPGHDYISDVGGNIKVINVDNMDSATEVMEKYEPEIIVAHDNLNKDISEVCSEIRRKSNLCRPVLMVLSEDTSIDKKLKAIKAGADDYEDFHNSREVSMRIYAHLRRHIEELSDPITRLAGANITYRTIKRNVESETMSLMYIELNNYVPYKEIYGYIAAEKLIKTFIAIVQSSINENDFLGQINENGFIILTTMDKAEKIATFLTYSFDMVAQKFYSSKDVERGYLLLTGDDKEGRRIPFVAASIGIVSNQFGSYKNYQEALNACINIQRLAKSKMGSFWLSDRPKIYGGDVIEEGQRHCVLIVEKDAALAYLLSTTLEMQGYDAETANNINEIVDKIEDKRVDLIMFDISEENSDEELQICKDLKINYPNIKLIISTVIRNKEKILDAGVDLYLPKPYELMMLFNWIDRLLNDEI